MSESISAAEVSQAEPEIKAEKRRRGWVIRKAEAQWRGNTSPKPASPCPLLPAPRTRSQHPSSFRWKSIPTRTAKWNDAKKLRRRKRNDSRLQPGRNRKKSRQRGNNVGKTGRQRKLRKKRPRGRQRKRRRRSLLVCKPLR